MKLTTLEVRNTAMALNSQWESFTKDLAVSPRIALGLIGVKRKLTDAAANVQETIELLLSQHGAKPKDGGLDIPEEKRASLEEALADLAKQELDLVLAPVAISDQDNLPFALVELMFPFLVVEGGDVSATNSNS